MVDKVSINGIDIGSSVQDDIKMEPADANDVSDIDISKLQYVSKEIEMMKEAGIYNNLCGLVRAIKIANKSDAFLISQIKKRFGDYATGLNARKLKKWLGGEYPELRDAYYFGRDIALGRLIEIGLTAAEMNKNTVQGGEFALKLLDKLDDGTIDPRNDINAKSNVGSEETTKTLAKLLSELEDVDEPEDVVKGTGDE